MREEIDRDIHRGLYTSVIARRFGLSKPTVTGHRRSGHHLLQPRRVYTGPHTAESLLARIEECRGDDQAMRALRIAVGTLPPGERRLLVEELRRRAGKDPEPVLARVEAAA
jgi:DNA-binding transcriptional ArsR family regulator